MKTFILRYITLSFMTYLPFMMNRCFYVVKLILNKKETVTLNIVDDEMNFCSWIIVSLIVFQLINNVFHSTQFEIDIVEINTRCTWMSLWLLENGWYRIFFINIRKNDWCWISLIFPTVITNLFLLNDFIFKNGISMKTKNMFYDMIQRNRVTNLINLMYYHWIFDWMNI